MISIGIQTVCTKSGQGTGLLALATSNEANCATISMLAMQHNNRNAKSKDASFVLITTTQVARNVYRSYPLADTSLPTAPA